MYLNGDIIYCGKKYTEINHWLNPGFYKLVIGSNIPNIIKAANMHKILDFLYSRPNKND